MRWAAVILTALFALSAPATLQAQEEAFTARSVRDALDRFGDKFLLSTCFDQHTIPLRIAVVQMEDSTKFLDYEAQIITDRIEQALAADRFFKVLPRRESRVLQDIAKALGESKSRGSGEQLDGLIVVRPEGGRSVNVVAYALANGTECVVADRLIRIGRIDRDPDLPPKLFERAAKKLFDKSPQRVVVMPPEIIGFGNGAAVRIMGRRLQGQLLDAINQVFQAKAQLSVTGAPVRSVAEPYGEGTEVAGAWQAILHLGRSSQGGIDVRIEFRGPAGQQGAPADGVSDQGYFAPSNLPTDSDAEVIICNRVKLDVDKAADPEALAALVQKNECPILRDEIVKKETDLRKEAACNRVRLDLDRATDPDALPALAQKNECPALHDEILKKEAFLRGQAACGRVRFDLDRATTAEALAVLFQKNECPALRDEIVKKEASLRGQAACSRVKLALDAATDPEALTDLVQKNECPRLHDEILRREALLRQRICDEDRTHWNNAVAGSLDAMESTFGTLRCPQVREGAERTLHDRREREAAIAHLKSAAADLGVLTDGQTAQRDDRAGGDDFTGMWKFQMAEADSVEIQVDDPTGTFTVELRDAAWRVVASARPGSAGMKGIEARLTSSAYPATYYIQVIPADPKRSAAYTLRAAKGFIDGAGNTPETARDLGSLGQDAQVIRKHIGGNDKGDFFRFTPKERSHLNLTVGDLTSDVRVELRNQYAQVVRTWTYRPGRQPQPDTPSTVEAGTTYYISVTPEGWVTPYSLSIALSRLVTPVAPFSRPDIAAPAAVGTPFADALPQGATHYYAKFKIGAPSPVSIDLTWEGQRTAPHLDLYRNDGELSLISPRPGSATPGPASLSSSYNLAPGEYVIRVTRDPGSSAAMPFRLTLRTVTPTVSSYASKEAAADIALGAPPVRYTLPASQSSYWAKFYLPPGTSFRVDLRSDAPAKALRVFLVRKDGPAMHIPQGIKWNLPSGDYWIRVERTGDGTGEVPFLLSLQRG